MTEFSFKKVWIIGSGNTSSGSDAIVSALDLRNSGADGVVPRRASLISTSAANGMIATARPARSDRVGQSPTGGIDER